MAVIFQILASSPSVFPTDASALESSISALRSSISALEISIKTLEESSPSWETFAWVCSIVVAIGVAAEIVGLVWEYHEEKEDWRRGIIRPPDHPPVTKFWFEVAATLLVVVGVFGEAGASAALASVNSHLRSKTSELRSKSDQLLALITLEAGDAASSASRAQGSANKAATAAGIAQKKAEAVGKEAHVIDWSLGMTQYLMTGREVKDQDALKKQLAPFKGQSVTFRSYLNDGDGYFLCEEILSSAKSAEMVTDDQCGSWRFSGTFPNMGISVFAPDEKSMVELNKIMAGLTAFGASGTIYEKNAPRPSTFVIFVGMRSPFRVGQARPTPTPKGNQETHQKWTVI
jgi:hypothetical protein